MCVRACTCMHACALAGVSVWKNPLRCLHAQPLPVNCVSLHLKHYSDSPLVGQRSSDYWESQV